MRTHNFKATLKAAVKVASLLLFGAVAAFGQQTINLTAAPANATMPDGKTVPMWGYFCGTAVTGSTATCAALNPNASGGWSPVVITVPYVATGTSLTINLTNNLSFLPAGSGTANGIPTSLTIVGQIGGGLGTANPACPAGGTTCTPSPSHAGVATDTVTWSTVGSAPGFTPPPQLPRAQSLATEVAAGATSSLTWTNLRPGTYLMESGTHPSIQGPMGLYGMLVVTCPPSATTACGTNAAGIGQAYPAGMNGLPNAAPNGVNYNAEVPAMFSEIDPVQNAAVNTAVNTPGFNEANTKAFGGAVGSVIVTTGGSGYTTNPTVALQGGIGSGATATASVGQVITGLALPAGGSGSGYTAVPAVTIAGGTPITTASATSIVTVSGATPNPTTGTGSGYVAGDIVHFTGGGGVGAAGTVATIGTGGTITAVTITQPGVAYTSAPTVSVGGTGATGFTVTLSSGAISTVTAPAGGTGTSYVVGDIVNFSDTTGAGAAAAVATVSPTGAVLTVTVSAGGAGYTAPTVSSVGGTGASLAATFTVSGFTVTNGGSGYTSPTATIPNAAGTGTIALTVSAGGVAGSVYAVDVTNGGSGYTMAPSVAFTGTSTVAATAIASLAQACSPAGAATGVASGAAAGCYPSAVNYTPLYYMVNGVPFDKQNANGSLFPATAGVSAAGTPVTTGIATTAGSTVLVRFINAGLRMHVPAILGSQTTGWNGAGISATVNGFSIIAEDGNPLPGAPKVQDQVLAVPGKVLDLMINVPTGTSALPIYDRELSLSAGAVGHDGGMLAYIGVNGNGITGAPLPGTLGAGSGVFAAAQANTDTYNALVPGQFFQVSDPGKGVIANDINVYGVRLLTQATSGTVVLNANGTFTYSPNAGSVAASDSFTYCANTPASVAACPANLTATVNLGAEANKGSVTANARAYTANTATYFALKAPGVLGTQFDTLGNGPDVDSAGYPLSVVTAPVAPLPATAFSAPTGSTLLLDAEGGFTASIPTPCTTAAGCVYNFTYTVSNTEGVTASNTVTLTFPAASGLQVKVVDGYDHTTQITDYRWLIEEDRTLYIDPNCTTNSTLAPGSTPVAPPAGCGAQTSTNGSALLLGANFHTSDMPYVAQGCTGPLSCEAGQTMYDARPMCISANNPVGCSATAGTHINAICDVGDGACRPDPMTANGGAGGKTPVMPSSVHLDPSKRYYVSVLPGDAGNPFVGGTSYAGPSGCNATTQTGNAGNMGALTCGHGMGGAPVPAMCINTPSTATPYTPCTPTTTTYANTPITILSQPSPYPTAKLSVFVFEDDFPLNGEHDSGGGAGGVNTNLEPGLGQFQIHLWDAFGGNGDFTGQMSFDMFNQFLTNGLAGQVDPTTGKDACPITNNARYSTFTNNGSGAPGVQSTLGTDPTATGITGMIVTCPEYESDGVTPSPLAGQALVENLMPGRWGVIATPGADRIARGEEWLQTNTLDGQKAHDSFTRIGEPSYFQEFGPAGWHVTIGFANPGIINARHQGVCNGTDPNVFGLNCTNTIKGQVQGERLSRTPDERLYGSGSYDAFAWTQCYVSLGDPDGEDFAFTKCDANGNFTLTNIPDGSWRVSVFDQWNDMLVDGLSTPVAVSGGQTFTFNPGIATTQWQANLNTRTCIDDNRNGICESNESGIPFANVNLRLRDGSLENLLVTDFTGTANFNETFPLFSWYTIETDTTRYKNTGIHVVYDVGGPADGSPSCGTTGFPPCGSSTIAKYLANTAEIISVPKDLRVPGAVYCADADCSTHTNGPVNGIQVVQTSSSTVSDNPSSCSTTAGNPATNTPPVTSCSTTLSSGRIDPPFVGVEGWQGFTGQFNFMEFGKAPYYDGENGGIHGHVEYASTRPFDDPQMLVQVQWTPLVPNVTINLYQEGVAADKVTPTLTLIDTTVTSSFDNWAQGFRMDATGTTFLGSAEGGNIPNISCPGQGAATGPIPDLFFYSLLNQPSYLDYYTNVLHGTQGTAKLLPASSQFKCYDGMHNWNQIQPAPFDGAYSFPSVAAWDPHSGRPTKTNCLMSTGGGPGCITDPVPTTGSEADPLRAGLPMLAPGKYVVEIVLPPGYELVKEEDKNILIGDNFIAPVTQQFGGLGNVFIIPDQASIASTYCTIGCTAAGSNPYNATNPQQPTQSFGTQANNNIVPGFVPEPTWPCVGEARVVPDYISLFPQTHQVSPFAGAVRNMCDRKEVTLADKMGATAKFFIYTTTHIAAKFTGGITDDYTSEFDPFSPTYGEKFSPPNMPVSIKDWASNEVGRTYADQWGSYDGMVFSTWEVNPPNPTGYAPGMMVFCMNDPGPIKDTRQTINGLANPTYNTMIKDPLFVEGYSQFCYELPFMPGTTQYLDTPVVPTSAFAGAGYNNVDCYYPDATPAVSEVDGDGHIGPWVAASGATLTIQALGDQMVPNYAYTGPAATVAPYNQKFIKRHYGFGTTNTPGGGLAAGGVTIGGVPATVLNWSDTTIQVRVPSNVPNCPVQQQAIYGGSTAQCGELVITSAASRVGGNVVSVSVTPPPAGNRGGTYTGTATTPPTAPTVTFAGGGGTGAAATATLGPSTGGVASVTVNTHGAGYTSAPTVVFTSGGGSGATATALFGRGVAAVTLVNQGRYGTTGTIGVTFSAGGGNTAATGTVNTTPSVFSVTMNTGGSGYPAGTTVQFTGGCTTEPTGTVTRNGAGAITAVTITNAGNGCSSMPTVSFTPAHPAGATLATATANAGRSILASNPVTITNPGSYSSTTTPTVTFTCAGCGGGTTTATGNTTGSPNDVTGIVRSVTVTAPGSGYTSAPTVSFTGGGTPTTAATATAALTAARTATVVSVRVTNQGSGYTSAPTVTFSGPASTRAVGTATINGPVTVVSGKQSVDTVTVTIGGKGPTHVTATQSVQDAIDLAAPGDLIIVDPTCTTNPTSGAPTAAACAPNGVVAAGARSAQLHSTAEHDELLVMWKPVRLQGVGAATSIINANTHPAGKLDVWRQRVNCLFGLALNGSPISTNPTIASGGPNAAANPFDPTNSVTCGTSPDGTVWNYFSKYDESGVNGNAFNAQVDRLPLEAVLGWNAELNGNLAEMLQEPSLMGALEGAAITVLGKGVDFCSSTTGICSDQYNSSLLAGFPTGTTLLQNTISNPGGAECLSAGKNPFPSNYSCNPSSIDGLGLTDSSQGGGAIFVHGWGHNLQIGNNRIYNNAGTLSGGINLGQGEFAPTYIQGSTTNAAPGSCEESPVVNALLPYCENVNVNVHNNFVALNSSTGDELFSATPAGAGGVSICTGSDYYKFNYNWVCGNLSSGDGGGVGHMGFSYNGDIEHNTIIFNQSFNPSIPANGGGLLIAGAPDQDVVCGNNINIDIDCSPIGQAVLTGTGGVTISAAGTGYAVGDVLNFAGGGGQGATGTVASVGTGGAVTGVNVTAGGAGYTAPVAVTITSAAGTNFTGIGNLTGPATTVQSGVAPSDGVGPGLVINANLIMGNTAEAGAGGGIAFNAVNGSDVVSFPTDGSQWNNVKVTNNIIADNVCGWDGCGISLKDSLNVDIINNTIVNNASTASAGILFTTLGAPLASQPPANGNTGPGQSNCTNGATTASCPQPAGVVAIQNSPILAANVPATITCPAGHFAPGTTATGTAAAPPTCAKVSYPKLENNIIWHNASYYVGVGPQSNQFQQSVVSLYNGFTTTLAPDQSSTGACVAATYWDLGVRGDTTQGAAGPGNPRLNPTQSVITAGYGGNGNSNGNPNFMTSYCDGSRTPPEAVSAGLIPASAAGWAVPPGIADATVPNPLFALTPTATVDEGNNWVNMRYGPLTLTNPTTVGGAYGNYGGGLPLANYAIPFGGASSAGSRVTTTTDAPRYDFFNTQRLNDADPGAAVDAGAIEAVPSGPVGGNGTQITVSPALVDFPFVPLHSGLSQDQDVLVTNAGSAPVAPLVQLVNSASNNFSLTPAPDPNGCPVSSASLTLGLGQSCIVNVSFTPETPSTTGLRAGTLNVGGGGVTQSIPLLGHITVGTISIVSRIPNGTLDPTPAATTAVVGTITLGNSENPATDPDAGPWVLTAPPSFTQTGTGTVALGGTCTTGVNVFPGQTCTITVTYTAPAAPASPNSSITVFFAQGTVLGTQTQGWTGNFTVQANIPAN